METSPHLLVQNLSGVVGRAVKATPSDAPVFSPNVLYACYEEEGSPAVAVAKLDLALLGSLAGAMMGVSSTIVATQVKQGQLDELLDDAAREIMNIMSAIFRNHRMLFKGLYAKPVQHSSTAETIARSSSSSILRLALTVPGYASGCLTVSVNFF